MLCAKPPKVNTLHCASSVSRLHTTICTEGKSKTSLLVSKGASQNKHIVQRQNGRKELRSHSHIPKFPLCDFSPADLSVHGNTADFLMCGRNGHNVEHNAVVSFDVLCAQCFPFLVGLVQIPQQNFSAAKECVVGSLTFAHQQHPGRF